MLLWGTWVIYNTSYVQMSIIINSESFLSRQMFKDMHILRVFIFLINFPSRKFLFSVSIRKIRSCLFPETSPILKLRFYVLFRSTGGKLYYVTVYVSWISGRIRNCGMSILANSNPSFVIAYSLLLVYFSNYL